MTVDWSRSVKTDGGGYMHLEDFCNSTDRGSQLMYTTGILLADEELFGVENGWRVANYVTEYAIDGWDALMDFRLRSAP